MEWINYLNQAMNYLEKHLTEKIDYEELADIANCPSYHFQRMFYYMTDITLSEYIRRRRMSLAAVELKEEHAKIIDVALKYGYSSPTAFNRAFQSVHGMAPSEIKKGNRPIKSYPKLCFSLSVHGMEELNFRIEKKKEFRIIGKSCPLSRKLEENFAKIPHEWDKAAANGTLAELLSFSNQPPLGLLGVSAHNAEEWKYFIAVSSDRVSDSYEEYQIPAAAWAIFSGRGTNRSLQELERRVITEWLPGSGYAYAEIPDIEVYIKADPSDAVYEYWLPVVRRQEETDLCQYTDGKKRMKMPGQ